MIIIVALLFVVALVCAGTFILLCICGAAAAADRKTEEFFHRRDAEARSVAEPSDERQVTRVRFRQLADYVARNNDGSSINWRKGGDR